MTEQGLSLALFTTASHQEDNGIPPGSVEIQQSSKEEGAGKGRLFERSMGDPRRKGIAVTKQGKDAASKGF